MSWRAKIVMGDYWPRWVMFREELAQRWGISMPWHHRVAVWCIRKLAGKEWRHV